MGQLNSATLTASSIEGGTSSSCTVEKPSASRANASGADKMHWAEPTHSAVTKARYRRVGSISAQPEQAARVVG